VTSILTFLPAMTLVIPLYSDPIKNEETLHRSIFGAR